MKKLLDEFKNDFNKAKDKITTLVEKNKEAKNVKKQKNNYNEVLAHEREVQSTILSKYEQLLHNPTTESVYLPEDKYDRLAYSLEIEKKILAKLSNDSNYIETRPDEKIYYQGPHRGVEICIEKRTIKDRRTKRILKLNGMVNK